MKPLLLLLVGLLLFSFVSAQSGVIEHMDVYIQPSLQQVISYNGTDTVVTSQVLKQPQMFIALSDTNNVSSFLVKIGTSPGSGNIIEKTFSFSTEGDFQDGTSYSRDGQYIRLLLGNYATLTTYYAQVQATVNGSQQQVVNYTE